MLKIGDIKDGTAHAEGPGRTIDEGEGLGTHVDDTHENGNKTGTTDQTNRTQRKGIVETPRPPRG